MSQADFCVTAVRYVDDHIEYVSIREELEGKIGQAYTVPTKFVGALIRLEKIRVITRVKNANGWAMGAVVHALENDYIATDKNNTQRDNLENLPEF